MYCPNCGIETSIDKRFCRGCGMDIRAVAQAFKGNPANLSTVQNMFSLQGAESPRKKVRRIGFITMGGGLLLASMLAIIGGAFSTLGGNLGNFVASLSGLGGLVFMLGIGIMIYSCFLPKTSSISHTSPYDAIPPAEPNVQIPPAPFRQSVSSVTENTTDLLDLEDRRERAHR